MKNDLSGHKARRAVLLLATCVALLMTGYGIVMPVFARRLTELGAGVPALGLMTTAFMLAQLIFAPFMGSLADRIGRKPVILLSLLAFALANVGYLRASSIGAFTLVRALQGALTAGLFPATLGMVGDLFTEGERARWVGIVSASYSAGFIFGPTIGGVLYDGWGYAAPFLTSAVLALLALAATAVLVPETRTPAMRAGIRTQARPVAGQRLASFSASLPRPLAILAILLLVDFVIIFAFAFVEPEMVFYMYGELGWTTTQFGIIVGAYALVTAAAQTAAGPLSERFPRRLIIVCGLVLNALFYVGLILVTEFTIMLGVAVLAGLGEALVMPAQSAAYLSISGEAHRGRVMGLKESAAALGGVLGPLLVAGASGVLSSYAIFGAAALLMLVTAVLALLFLRLPREGQTVALPVPEGARSPS